jgi:hypothetical protein
VVDNLPDLAEGGWGWALIRAMTTDLSYVRCDDRNLLTFQVPLSAPVKTRTEAGQVRTIAAG